jgi:hypothetical protein
MLRDEIASDNLDDEAYINMIENKDTEGGRAEEISFYLQSLYNQINEE